MKERAEELVNAFLTETSDHALNLPSAQLAVFSSGLKTSTKISANMFDSIARVIYRAIEMDTFPRFKTTSSAKELVRRLPKLARRSSDSRSSKQRSSSRQTGASTDQPSAAAETGRSPRPVA